MRWSRGKQHDFFIFFWNCSISLPSRDLSDGWRGQELLDGVKPVFYATAWPNVFSFKKLSLITFHSIYVTHHSSLKILQIPKPRMFVILFSVSHHSNITVCGTHTWALGQIFHNVHVINKKKLITFLVSFSKDLSLSLHLYYPLFLISSLLFGLILWLGNPNLGSEVCRFWVWGL